jgi:hypothetical protein
MVSPLEDRWRSILTALKRGFAQPPYEKYHMIRIRCPSHKSCRIDTNLYGKIGRVPGTSNVRNNILVISHIAIVPQASGHFRTFLDILMDLQGFKKCIDAIEIECLHNERFAQTLVKNGWIEEDDNYYFHL